MKKLKYKKKLIISIILICLLFSSCGLYTLLNAATYNVVKDGVNSITSSEIYTQNLSLANAIIKSDTTTSKFVITRSTAANATGTGSNTKITQAEFDRLKQPGVYTSATDAQFAELNILVYKGPMQATGTKTTDAAQSIPGELVLRWEDAAIDVNNNILDVEVKFSNFTYKSAYARKAGYIIASDYEGNFAFNSYGLLQEADSLSDLKAGDDGFLYSIPVNTGIAYDVEYRFYKQDGTIANGKVGFKFTDIDVKGVDGVYTYNNYCESIEIKNGLTSDMHLDSDTLLVHNTGSDGSHIFSGTIGDSNTTRSGVSFAIDAATNKLRWSGRNCGTMQGFLKMQGGNVIVNHVDTQGNELAPQETISGYVGGAYTTASKTFEDYYLKTTPNNANGIIAVDTTTVTYVYDLIDTNVIAKYIDQKTGLEISDFEEYPGKIKTIYETQAKDIDGYELVVTPNNATGTRTKDTITVVYEYLKNANVTAKYVDENTGKTINPDITNTYKEGDTYSTNQLTISGYTYTRVNGTTSGTIAREDIEVTYYYKKNTDVVAKYVDKTTGVEIENQVQKTGLEGDDYTTEKKTINGYTWVSTIGNSTGKMGATQIVVTYEYLKNADVITKFVDENTGASIENDVIDHYKEGDTYTTTKKDIVGYTYSKVEGTESGTIGRENVTVTYYYKQNAGIVAKYIDQVTKEEIADRVPQEGVVGKDYTTEAKDIDGYTLVVTPNNATGKMTSSLIEVTYEYRKNADVITKFVDENTGASIENDVTDHYKEGDTYTTTKKDIAGYTYSKVEGTESGTVGRENVIVTYYYKQNTGIVTRHIDQVTKQEIADSVPQNGVVGQDYTTTAKNIDGYTLVVTPANANGKMTTDTITVTYEYLKNTGVVAKYIDQVTGEEIETAVPQIGLEGQDYVTTEKIISGYELVKIPGNKTGKMAAEQITVTYEYRKIADVITRFIDENTNKEIIAFETDTYKEGDNYTTSKKDIVGYTYTKVEGNESGTIGRENIEVKYYYKKISSGVIVNYIDQVTGASVTDSESFTGLENDKYVTEAKEVDGYKLVVIPENKEGNMTSDTIVVTYEYLKVVNVVAKYIDLNTKEELAERTFESYLQGDMYSTVRKNIEGYHFMYDTENVSGLIEDKDIEVIYYYRPISSGVEIKYVDKDNNELLSEDTVSGLIGDKYTTTELSFEDYNFVEVIGETEGMLQKDPIEVTYYYIKKRGTVTISYIDEDGNELYHEELEDYVKEEWKHKEKVIEGYEIVKRPEQTEGIFIDGNIDVVYVLKRIKGTITVKFMDKVGNVLAEEEFSENFVGEDYKFNAPEIEGYVIIENAKIELQYVDGEIVVTVVYDKAPETGDINVVMLTIVFALSLVIISKRVIMNKVNK